MKINCIELPINCPIPDCEEELRRKEIELICETCKPKGLFLKYVEFLGKKFLELNQDQFFSCLKEDCNAVTDYDAD